ncbi:MAG: FtsQ-type POTRA domain-containing protein [Acidobacteriota bacterium]|nr:FtsQ-type POTRA domain-containing protein [Acidobacteriota bacterium]
MAVKKRPATGRISSAARKPRKRTIGKGSGSTGKLANFLLPLFLAAAILFCLGCLSLIGYRTATASSFFDVKAIDVRGVNRASKDDIERLARLQTNKSGVWNADLSDIKTNIEKLMFVKSAVVSRVLPDGLRVNVTERVPRVVIRLKSGDVWADEDAVMLGTVKDDETRPPFVLRGWDESKSDKSAKENQERVKICLKMLNDWQDFDLASRVSSVNLADLQDPQAIVQDSGEFVTISLGKENFGKRLQKALEVVANKGTQIESIISNGQNVVLKYRNS